MSIKHYPVQKGFVQDTIKEGDYVLGGFSLVPKIILEPERNWLSYIPVNEPQAPNFETYSCTAHTLVNAITTLEKRQGYETDDYSERFLAKISGTKEGGNSPHTVAEYARKIGFVKEEKYPALEAKTWEEYYKTIPAKIFDYARDWIFERVLMHDYVPTTPEAMWEALQYSPLGVSVTAWYQEGDYFIKPEGLRDNHNTLIVFGVYGEYWVIFDSYAPFIKKVKWDYKFEMCKRYYVGLQVKESWFDSLWIIKLIKRLWK